MPPPPPPPAPVPPPVLAPFKPSGGVPDKNALLASIQKGAKLKKTVTVDKSGPLIAGKSTSNEPPRRSNAAPNKRSPEITSPSSSRPVLDFSSELAQKLTMKKKKASGESPQSNTSPVSQNQSDFKPKSSPMNNTSTKPSFSNSEPNALPNKSTLFANKNPAFEAAKSNISASLYPNPTPKIINHGKPNLAPKPPNFQLKLVPDASSDDNNNTSGSTGRQNSVARHHSMKSPRSPPVSLLAGPFTSDNHFGTIRGNPLLKHQDALNQSLINKQNTPLPSRPLQKPPPPPPIRSISNTNLSQTSAKSTTALNMSSTETTWSNNSRNLRIAGSSNNLPSLDSVSSHTSDDIKAAPPLPPHRTTRTVNTQNTTNNINNNVNNNSTIPQAPPAPPQRHSSIRNSNNGSSNTLNQKHLDNSTDIGKILVDLELRYARQFHNETDFPKPQRFLDLDKTYPSRSSTVRQSNGGF